MENIYSERQKKVSSLMKREDVAVLILWDREGMRDANISYLTGCPADAVLFLFNDGRNILLPWDINLGRKLAFCYEIRPFTAYNRDFHRLLDAILKERNINQNEKIELPAMLPYPEVTEIMGALPNSFLCRNGGLEDKISEMRQIKDEEELKIIRNGAKITNLILDKIQSAVLAGDISEKDLNFLISDEVLAAGAEGVGFETIVANPARSGNIHAFPACTAAKFIGNGLSLIDFGIKKDGYTSDVTVTFVKNPTEEQQKMVNLVENAVKIVENSLVPGKSTMELTKEVCDFFKANGYEMPHALGHGIGLEIHESPVLRTRKPDSKLLPGMVLAIEPGIYSENGGGVRLENDYLITENGFEKLTNSRIIHL